ncbi:MULTISPECIES: DUF1320 domain-containing protein [unclassified Ensifer]|uniref:gp436 family protein n=1 Tax=unclassified Ensifer TaxID=2633371 RepID=UPI00081351D6|nr:MULTISPECIES: DUF1320 domain-containing protein [unclassified Ensifer]OCP17377.1 hypothetical protein BC361_07915 [Ensifer sp. LC54]OCP28718.1 hypothetical protein BC363_02445 [Ensifer sp. LC384]
MAYAALEDLNERAGEDEIRQIADRDRDGAPDPAVIEAAVTHADNIVNGYLGARFKLPLPTIPDLVRTWAVSIARYYLHGNMPPEYVATDYKDAITQLKDAARGLISLPDIAGNEPAKSGGTSLVAEGPGFFNDRTMRGW